MSWWSGKTAKPEKMPSETGQNVYAYGSYVYNSAAGLGNVTASILETAGSGVKNWYNNRVFGAKTTEKSENQNSGSGTGDGIRGFAYGMAKNANQFVVKTGGRASNIVNFFDKTNVSNLGNPRWFARVDKPHGNVAYHHINVNPKITGRPDPHIKISATTAGAMGYLGKTAEVLNRTAGVVSTAVFVHDLYQIGKEAKKDYELGTTRNTIQMVGEKAGLYTSAAVGANLGATAGTFIFPGVGTFFGGLGGGVLGSYYGGAASQIITEKALDYKELDVKNVPCEASGCANVFKWRKFEKTNDQKLCDKCNAPKSKL